MSARFIVMQLLLCAALPSFAQVGVPGGTTSANPAVATQRSIPDRPLERPDPAAIGRPLATEPPRSETGPSGPRDAAADSQTLTVQRVVFSGATVLAADELSVLATPYQGRVVTFGELQQLAAKVEALYRQRGYLAVRVVIPTQKVQGGVVQLAIFEGRYGQVKVVGNRRYSERFIRRYFEFARAGELVHQRRLLHTLLVLREFPGLGIRSALESGATPGTTDLSLHLTETKPFHFGYEYNNFGFRLVGRNRAAVFASHSGTFTDGDELSVRYTELFPSDSDPIYQGSYLVPVGRRGDRVGAQYLRSKTRVGGVFVDLDLRGDVEIAALTWARPLRRDLRTATSLSASLSAKTVKSFVFGNTLTSQDDLRVFGAAYSITESRAQRRSFCQLALSQGLGGLLGGRENGDPLASRVGAGNEFTKVNADHIALVQVGERGSLVLRASGQLSDGALTVAELFSIGGADSVRGFVQSEALGDRGYFVSAELRHRIIQKKNLRLEGALFLDDGHVTIAEPQPGERSDRHLTGGGAGIRAGLGSWGTLRLEVGFPISEKRSIEGDSSLLYAQHTAQF